MKSKLLNAFIIDQDPAQGAQFSKVVKELFSKLYLQKSINEALLEYKEVRPHVIFLNLTLDQRSANLEILEGLDFTTEDPTIIFGYNDGAEAELLAHAIESGIQDIFLRPYDPDIISTKINRFFISEKTQNRNLSYSRLIPPIKAQLKFNLKLVAVDENGLTFKGDHYISKGTSFPIKNDLMKEIFEAEDQYFMVTKTWIGDTGKDFFLFAEPKDAKEQTAANLRRFILRKI
jgi:response regulator RpfG family c-di-GMP phosphodiesterase